jgi:NAD/NADP transhydrogenase alpha subunit
MTYSEKRDIAQSAVAKMLSSISEKNPSPHYMGGYLEEMITGWAANDESILKHVIKNTELIVEELSEDPVVPGYYGS